MEGSSDAKINGGRHHCRPVLSAVFSRVQEAAPAVAKLLPALALWPSLRISSQLFAISIYFL